MAKAEKSAKKGNWSVYSVSGSKLERKNRYCPKCGSGVYLAKHTNRDSCGKCGYTEMKK